MPSPVALGPSWRLAIEGTPLLQGTWDLFLPHGHFERAVCAIGRPGDLGGSLWSETADVLSAAAERFLPLPQHPASQRGQNPGSRGSPRLPGMETSMRGWVRPCRPLPSPERPSGAWDTELPPHPSPEGQYLQGWGFLERVGPPVFPPSSPHPF